MAIERTLSIIKPDATARNITGKIILNGYGSADVLIGETALGNVLEIHGGDGDDVIQTNTDDDLTRNFRP